MHNDSFNSSNSDEETNRTNPDELLELNNLLKSPLNSKVELIVTLSCTLGLSLIQSPIASLIGFALLFTRLEYKFWNWNNNLFHYYEIKKCNPKRNVHFAYLHLVLILSGIIITATQVIFKDKLNIEYIFHGTQNINESLYPQIKTTIICFNLLCLTQLTLAMASMMLNTYKYKKVLSENS